MNLRLGSLPSTPSKIVKPLRVIVDDSMTSRLELLRDTPDKIEVPLVQVQYHSFMDHYHFRIHYALASPTSPLEKISDKVINTTESGSRIEFRQVEYRGSVTPNISFNLDPDFDLAPAQELPHSRVWSGIGLGYGGYKQAKATSSSEEGIVVAVDQYNTTYLARDIDETTVQEVVEALAGNRLPPPNWRQEQSAFKIDDGDKPLFAAFMRQQLAPYLHGDF